MEEKREQQAEGPEYSLGELVWAKITGFPWWPARVTAMPNTGHLFYRVDFFSDNTHAFLDCSKVAKYDDLRAHIDRGRPLSKGLKRAIGQADQLLQQLQLAQSEGEPAPAPVEVPGPNQKQLLQLPLLLPLQENFPTDQVVQPIEQASPESQQSSQQHQLAPVFTRHQRINFVNQLLKKYRLSTLPKLQQSPPVKTIPRGGPSKLRNKKLNRKSKQSKRRPINKTLHERTLSLMLTRKIRQLLKQKEGLCSLQSKQISLSLSRQVTAGGVDPEETRRLFKWVSISTADSIANFYENWGSLQSDKEKPSYMTTVD